MRKQRRDTMGRPPLPEHTRQAIRDMLAQKIKPAVIADELGVGLTTVYNEAAIVKALGSSGQADSAGS